MNHTRLGRTGLAVSRITLGTMTFGVQADEATSHAILDRAAAGGVTLIDTADVYPLGGNHATVGRTEEIIGRWLKGKRESFIVATKAYNKMGPAAWDRGSSRKHLLSAIDASLKRLQTDYVDLYQLHRDDPNTPLDETLAALDTIVQSGRARYVGVSNFLAWRLAKAVGLAQWRQWAPLVSVQPRYSLVFREIERELLPLAAEEGLGVIPYNPLAGGLLTGKHDPAAGPQAGTRFAYGALSRERYWNERCFETVTLLKQVVAEAGLPMTTTAVAWVLANPAVTSAIVGASRPEQLDDTLQAADLALDPAFKARLDEISAEHRQGDAGT